MSIHGALQFLESLPLAATMRSETSSTEWTFTTVETIHILALATVFGTIAMVDLRLLGWTERDSAVSSLTKEVLPWTWISWVIAAISGSLMFISKATIYASNPEFQLKFVCMALAGINMAIFNLNAFKTVAKWDTSASPPPSARFAGASSLLLWIGVIFFGRWVGFTT